MRKLSIGLVSCIVGYGVFGIPVFAEKIDNFQEGHAIVNTERNILTNDTLNDTGELELSISDIGSNMLLTNSYTDKEEVIVTDETKTPYNKESIKNIDNTVLDSEGNFIGKEDGSVSISGNKDIASKEDLDEKKTVDEFNAKYRSEKTEEIKEGIQKEKQKKKEERLGLVTEMSNHYQSRAEEFLRDLEIELKDDLEEMRKINADWAFVAENDVIKKKTL